MNFPEGQEKKKNKRERERDAKKKPTPDKDSLIKKAPQEAIFFLSFSPLAFLVELIYKVKKKNPKY